MATAPEIQTEAPAESGEAIDYEAAASKLGWKPLDEFGGDPARHVDAETFYKRGQELMPILKAQNKQLTKRLEALEKANKQASEYFSKAEERAYQRAIDEIRREQEAAVEAGDLDAHRKAAAKLDKLDKPAPAAREADPEARAEEFADWGKENKWYAANKVMASYADVQADLLAAKKGGILDRADLDAVAEKVRAKFPEEFAETEATKPRRGAVEGVSNGRRTSGHTFADLPPEAKVMCDKLVRNGIIKGREDYVKVFDFKGYAS